MSYKRFYLEKCIGCDTWFINYVGDYPFCENCMVIVDKGLDTSTIPTERFRRIKELLEA